MSQGIVFNIQKCSIHDGRGMRTTVFFKGCGMHCMWCANPESIHPFPEISYNKNVCIKCGICTKVCPNHAIEMSADDSGIFCQKDRCQNCGKCAEVCCMDARHMYGRQMSEEELFQEIYRDDVYYRRSGGGVTFSGGEVLLQWEFLRDVCKRCKNYGIHTAIETCGFADYEHFKGALPYIDFIYFDLKHMDEKTHQRLTGQSNQRILENLKRMNEWGMEIQVRTPIVPGYNNTKENLLKTAEYLTTLSNVTKYELLPYHQLGISKYQALARSYPLSDVVPPTDEQMFELQELANKVLKPYGKECIYNYDNSQE